MWFVDKLGPAGPQGNGVPVGAPNASITTAPQGLQTSIAGQQRATPQPAQGAAPAPAKSAAPPPRATPQPPPEPPKKKKGWF